MNERENNIALGDLYELVLKYVAKYIKAKILTAQYQAVRILYSAPDRHILIISIEIFRNSQMTDYQINT